MNATVAQNKLTLKSGSSIQLKRLFHCHFTLLGFFWHQLFNSFGVFLLFGHFQLGSSNFMNGHLFKESRAGEFSKQRDDILLRLLISSM